MILLVVCALKAELLGQHERKPGGRARGHYLTKRVDCVEEKGKGLCSKVRENANTEEREDVRS